MSPIKRFLYCIIVVSAALLFSSCASKQAINVKIHTDPEGSHIVYRVENNLDEPWIYLGITPYQGVTLMDSSAFEEDSMITFKVMRHGYLDQVKQWTGGQFLEEYDDEGLLLWTPRLVKAGQ